MDRDDRHGFEFEEPYDPRYDDGRRPEFGYGEMPGPVPGSEFGYVSGPGPDFGYSTGPRTGDFEAIPGDDFGRGPAVRDDDFDEFGPAPAPLADDFGRGSSFSRDVGFGHDLAAPPDAFGRGAFPYSDATFGGGAGRGHTEDFGRGLPPEPEYGRDGAPQPDDFGRPAPAAPPRYEPRLESAPPPPPRYEPRLESAPTPPPRYALPPASRTAPGGEPELRREPGREIAPRTDFRTGANDFRTGAAPRHARGTAPQPEYGRRPETGPVPRYEPRFESAPEQTRALAPRFEPAPPTQALPPVQPAAPGRPALPAAPEPEFIDDFAPRSGRVSDFDLGANEFGGGLAPRADDFGGAPARPSDAFGGDPVRPARSEPGSDLALRSQAGGRPAPKPGSGRDIAVRSASRAEFVVDAARKSDFGDATMLGVRESRKEAEETPVTVRTASRGVLDIMRGRNLVAGLAVPVAAAVIVGVAVVVVTGGGNNGGTTAQSALQTSFQPAIVAGAAFTGANGATPVTLDGIGASNGTEVAVGSANGNPALWDSADGGGNFNQAALGGAAGNAGALAGAAHGKDGWIAAGTLTNGNLFVVSSPNAANWTTFPGLGAGTAKAVAGNAAGQYVVVGSQKNAAAAWSSTALMGLNAAKVTPNANGTQQMNAVTAATGGFVAVGQTGANPAAWVSQTGAAWQEVQVPAPNGATQASLKSVTASGQTIVAAGTETAGATSAFTEVSADGGKTWAEVGLPSPAAAGMNNPGFAATSITASGNGFTTVGTVNEGGSPEVVIWTSGTAKVTSTGAWTEQLPTGTGLSSGTTQNQFTAIALDGVTLAGVGSTGPIGAKQQKPTLWQSPIRN